MSAKYLPAEERRAVTVEAVLALAATKSPGEITTAAIAQQMDLTQGALFRHFPNKDAVWQAVMEWIASRLLARVEESAAAASTPLAALEAVFMAHIDFVCLHPGVPRLVFSELQRPDDSGAKRVVRSLLKTYGKRVTGLIKAGQAAGQIDASIDATAARLLFIGAIQGLVVQSLLAQRVRAMRSQAPGVFATYRRGIEKLS